MEEKKIFCQNCGSEIFNPEQEYCLACGAKLMQESAPVENYNILTAWQSFFKRYADFKGRSRRQEYWLAWLANVIISLAFSILLSALEPALGRGAGILDLIYGVLSTASGLYILVTIIPNLAIQTRRLHDTGRSGKLLLLWLIPALSGVVCIVSMSASFIGALSAYGWNLEYALEYASESFASGIISASLALLVMLISTIVLGIIFLVFYCQNSEPGMNKYGKSPKGISD